MLFVYTFQSFAITYVYVALFAWYTLRYVPHVHATIPTLHVAIGDARRFYRCIFVYVAFYTRFTVAFTTSVYVRYTRDRCRYRLRAPHARVVTRVLLPHAAAHALLGYTKKTALFAFALEDYALRCVRYCVCYARCLRCRHLLITHVALRCTTHVCCARFTR